MKYTWVKSQDTISVNRDQRDIQREATIFHWHIDKITFTLSSQDTLESYGTNLNSSHKPTLFSQLSILWFLLKATGGRVKWLVKVALIFLTGRNTAGLFSCIAEWFDNIPTEHAWPNWKGESLEVGKCGSVEQKWSHSIVLIVKLYSLHLKFTSVSHLRLLHLKSNSI